MKDLTEAKLIEMEHTARELAVLAADYNDYGRKSVREHMAALGSQVSDDVETLCQRVSIEAQKNRDAAPPAAPTPEFNAGQDCALHGANEENCNYRHFATREQIDEWERGCKEVWEREYKGK